MPGNDGGRPARHPPGRCCATFKSAPGGFVPTPESAHRQTTDKTKGPVFRLSLSFYLMPGNSLLSHGETPHYHRRYGVSLLSSAWGQVGPPRSRRQANSLQVPNFNLKSGADTQSRTGDLTLTKGALYQLSHISTLNLMPGSSLLSHGETPHYHRRYGVSLLSSAWGQVGPPRYRRQANSVLPARHMTH
jgi:hypothetical protein